MPEAVLRAMEREADSHAPEESGGVLLGYRACEDRKLIQVEMQVGPGPAAIHGLRGFEPDAIWQEKRIAAAYAESGQVTTYLGDWHSHPSGSSKPSGLDRSTARRIARCREAGVRRPLMAILWGERADWRVSVYRGGYWRLRPTEATVVASSEG